MGSRLGVARLGAEPAGRRRAAENAGRLAAHCPDHRAVRRVAADFQYPRGVFTASSVSLRHALSNHQHVVIVMRDVCHVAERLTHALAESVDRRAEGVI